MGTDLNMFFAFGAGFLSFISPCTLPLYPAFLSYITGMSLDDLQSDSKRMNKTWHASYAILFNWIFAYFCCTGLWIIISRNVFSRKYCYFKTNRCHFHRFIRSYNYGIIYTRSF